MGVEGIPRAFLAAFGEKRDIEIDGDPSKAPNGCPYEIEITTDGTRIYHFHYNYPPVGLPFDGKTSSKRGEFYG